MAKFLALSLSLCFLLLGGGFASREQQSQGNECQLDRLNALRPDNRIESEGGLIETWNPNNEQFRCAGVALSRCTLERNALRRPFYSNAPQEIFIEQGNGIFGMIFPGCPNTFEEPQESEREQSRRTQPDRHQKVHRFREGDVIAVPTGVAFWMYNDQETPVVAVSLLDTSSLQNQLDQVPRRFYLAGSQEQEFIQYQHQHRQQSPRGSRRQGGRRQGEQENEGGNIFNGFSKEFLEDAFSVNREIVNNLQGENEDEERGAIVTVKEGLHVISPPMRPPRRQHVRRGEEEERVGRREEEQERQRREDEDEDEYDVEDEDEEESRRSSRRQDRRSQPCRGRRCSRRREDNGIEEDICSLRLRHNIGRNASPDIYNPEAGSIKTTSSLDFPALSWLRLSAEHGTLHNNAMFVPHYNLNANSVLYALRGRAHIQVVNSNGETVFDEELEAGRALVIPQNFAVAARSRSDRFRYVAFKTNDRPLIQTIAGGSSLIKGLPEEVVAETFNLRREQASQLKNNNPFRFLVPPRESQRRDVA